MFKLKLLVLISIVANCNFISAQKIDTLFVNKSLEPYRVVSVIDTIKRNKYSNTYIISMSISSLKLNNFVQEISDTLSEYGFIDSIYYTDINLDDFNDINISYEDTYGIRSNFSWLYDSASNKFVYANDLNLIPDEYLVVNRKKKIIKVYDQWYHGIVCASEYLYKIESFKLKLLEVEGCGKFDFDSYYFYKKKLLNDTIRIVELDSLIHIDSEYIKKSYSFIIDTLLLKSIYWADEKRAEFTDSSNPKIYFETEFTGVLKCTRKEEYAYTQNAEGKLERIVKRYVVQNDRWVPQLR